MEYSCAQALLARSEGNVSAAALQHWVGINSTGKLSARRNRNRSTAYCTGSREGLLATEPVVITTGLFPVPRPEGTTALIWYRPTKPGAMPL